MGRAATYSGKIIERALNSNLALAPNIRSMGDAPPVLPDERGQDGRQLKN